MSKRTRAEKNDGHEVDDLDDMIENIPTQMEEMLSEVQDRCKAHVAAAKEEAVNLKAEAEKIVQSAHNEVEAMKVELANWEEEKKRIASTHNVEATIKLDIGGQLFTTTLTTLTRFPEAMLGAMFSGRHALTKNEAGAHFIDRDGRHFHEILNFLRSPETFDNEFQGRQLTELKNESEYYGLKDLMFPFVPAKPVIVTSYSGYSITITQDNDQLWYIQCVNIGVAPLIVQVCDNCGLGFPTGQCYSYGNLQFTTGRTIIAAQPRNTGTCGYCGK